MCIKSKSMFFASAGVAVIAASLATASTAMATTTTPTTIISDTFPTSQGIGAGSYLQGSTPDGADLPGSTWQTNYVGGTLTSASDPFIASNAAYFPDAATGNVSAAIAFTPNGNGLLSLTATLTYAGGEWVAMGFANSAATASPSQAGPWMLMTKSGSTVQMFGANGSSNLVPSTKLTSNTNTITLTYNPATMVETMNVSDSTSGADYISASEPLSYFSVGGKSITTPPTIGSIFFAVRAGNPNGSSFSNVTLTQGPAVVVPEPSAAQLLSLGGVAALLLVGRRRKPA